MAKVATRMESEVPVFTETQKKLLKILSNGEPHSPKELMGECIDDDLASKNNLEVHLYYLRRKLRPLKHDILCVWVKGGGRWYQHVALLDSTKLSQLVLPA